MNSNFRANNSEHKKFNKFNSNQSQSKAMNVDLKKNIQMIKTVGNPNVKHVGSITTEDVTNLSRVTNVENQGIIPRIVEVRLTMQRPVTLVEK